MAERWLLADIGGTHTRLGLARPDSRKLDHVVRLTNSAFATPDALIHHYLDATQPGPLTALCAGAAGPVRDGKVQLTNHRWCIEAEALSRLTGATRAILLNDLQAQGYALDDLAPEHLTPLFPGKAPPPMATRLVFGLGTGSNAAVVHSTDTGLLVPPSESGHAGLPYGDAELAPLVAHLGQTHPHHPMEAALSGPGLSRIHDWVTGDSAAPRTILDLHRQGDASAIRSVRLFARMLGHVAGDLAMTHLPMGGLFFIGGLARAVTSLLADTAFHSVFTAKGPYSPILRDISIQLITDDHAALLGCARALRQSGSGHQAS